MNKKLRGDLMLILAAMIWGSAFVAQKSGADLMGPIAFNGIRILIGGLVLLPVISIMDRLKGRTNTGAEGGAAMSMTKEEKRAAWKNALKGGILCGLALATAAGLQQLGICYTTAGKAGFITALYVVIVPIFGLVFLEKESAPRDLALRHRICHRAVSALHPFRRRILPSQQGRYDHADMCDHVRYAYTYH